MADDTLVRMKQQCGTCEKNDNLQQCARCKRVMYCCREHQTQHWKVHKIECRKIKLAQRESDVSSLVVENMDTIKNDGDENRLTRNTQVDSQISDSDIGMEFDARPLNRPMFVKPMSYDTKDIALFITDHLAKDGFCVVDGAFDTNIFENLLCEVRELDANGKMNPGQIAGGRTSSEDSQKLTETTVRSDKIVWVEGTERHLPCITMVLHKMDAIVTCCNGHLRDSCIYINGRTKAMVACYPGNGSCYRRHIDNPNKDGRVITCILYLNKDWNVAKDGGLLRILPAGTDDHIDIHPLLNRLLFFWSDCRNPHEVQPAFKTRYAITVWYFDKLERQQAKMAKVNEELSLIRGEMALLDVKTREVQKTNLTQKIQSESAKAVKMLTDEEMSAIASLIKDQPNPRNLLSTIGIAPSIQDALLLSMNRTCQGPEN